MELKDVALGISLLIRLLTWRRVKATIEWPDTTDQIKAQTALNQLEQADGSLPKVRRSLILQLIKIGLLPGITADYAEPEKYKELMQIVESRAYPDGIPES